MAADAVRATVLEEMVRIGKQQGKTMPELTGDLPLLDTGLDSLCLAILVATLEDRLGVDPFSGEGPAEFPVTVDDLVAAYQHAAGG